MITKLNVLIYSIPKKCILFNLLPDISNIFLLSEVVIFREA